MLRSTKVQYELAGRGAGTVFGGIGLMQQLVRTLGLQNVNRPLAICA